MKRLLLLLALAGMAHADDVRTMGRQCDYNVYRNVTELGDNTYLITLSSNQSMRDLKIWDSSNQTPTIINFSCPHVKFSQPKGAVEISLYGSFSSFSCFYTIKTKKTPNFRGYFEFISGEGHFLVCDVKPKIQTMTTTSLPLPTMTTTTYQTTTYQDITPTTQEIRPSGTTTPQTAPEKPTETPASGLFDGLMHFFMHLI